MWIVRAGVYFVSLPPPHHFHPFVDLKKKIYIYIIFFFLQVEGKLLGLVAEGQRQSPEQISTTLQRATGGQLGVSSSSL